MSAEAGVHEAIKSLAQLLKQQPTTLKQDLELMALSSRPPLKPHAKEEIDGFVKSIAEEAIFPTSDHVYKSENQKDIFSKFCTLLLESSATDRHHRLIAIQRLEKAFREMNLTNNFNGLPSAEARLVEFLLPILTAEAKFTNKKWVLVEGNKSHILRQNYFGAKELFDLLRMNLSAEKRRRIYYFGLNHGERNSKGEPTVLKSIFYDSKKVRKIHDPRNSFDISKSAIIIKRTKKDFEQAQ